MATPTQPPSKEDRTLVQQQFVAAWRRSRRTVLFAKAGAGFFVLANLGLTAYSSTIHAWLLVGAGILWSTLSAFLWGALYQSEAAWKVAAAFLALACAACGMAEDWMAAYEDALQRNTM